jgi:hypothetical protein
MKKLRIENAGWLSFSILNSQFSIQLMPALDSPASAV